jgi:hypothetical protein
MLLAACCMLGAANKTVVAMMEDLMLMEFG